MTSARLQTKRPERFVGMPAKASAGSAVLPVPTQSCYVGPADVSPIRRGYEENQNPVGANLS